LVVTLARSWAKLTGLQLDPYGARFYELVDGACQLVGIEPTPSKNSVASWVRREMLRQTDPNNSAPQGE
jgi:hypothetical protein